MVSDYSSAGSLEVNNRNNMLLLCLRIIGGYVSVDLDIDDPPRVIRDYYHTPYRESSTFTWEVSKNLLG
jgi:hypothetical protein